MAHSAAIYEVTVHERRHRHALHPFGDFDGEGTNLVQVLRTYFTDVFVEDDEREIILRNAEGVDVDEEADEACIVLEVGQRGVASVVEDPTQKRRGRRRAIDAEFVRVAVLAHLPPDSETGFLALHVPHRRGIKQLLEKSITQRLNEDFHHVLLEFKPVVPRDALEQAIESNDIRQVKLVVIEQPADRFADATKWVDAEDLARIELVMYPKKLRRVKTEMLRLFQQDHETIDQLVRFEGMTFDQAKVKIPLRTGGERTINIERPGAGHPMTIDLADKYALAVDADGDPMPEGLIDALRHVLGDIVSGGA